MSESLTEKLERFESEIKQLKSELSTIKSKKKVSFDVGVIEECVKNTVTEKYVTNLYRNK